MPNSEEPEEEEDEIEGEEEDETLEEEVKKERDKYVYSTSSEFMSEQLSSTTNQNKSKARYFSKFLYFNLGIFSNLMQEIKKMKTQVEDLSNFIHLMSRNLNLLLAMNNLRTKSLQKYEDLAKEIPLKFLKLLLLMETIPVGFQKNNQRRKLFLIYSSKQRKILGL